MRNPSKKMYENLSYAVVRSVFIPSLNHSFKYPYIYGFFDVVVIIHTILFKPLFGVAIGHKHNP